LPMNKRIKPFLISALVALAAVLALSQLQPLVLLALAFAAMWTEGRTQRQILVLSFVLSLGGVGFSAYLTYLEIYVIEALCAWCVASAVIITVLAIVAGFAIRLAPQHEV